jgi:hypothetical protein
LSFFPWSAGHVAVDINDAGYVIADGTGKRVCGKTQDLNSTAPSPIPIINVYCDTPSMVIDRAGQAEIKTERNYSKPTAINNLGQMSFFKNQNYRENAINSTGIVTGQWAFRNQFVAFVNEQDGEMVNIPKETDESSGVSINDAGVVVGKRHNTYIVPFCQYRCT